MLLSFLCLPVIPSLKLTDKGLVDVDKFQFTDMDRLSNRYYDEDDRSLAKELAIIWTYP
jgi:Adenine deaminase C-terminal domain